MFRARDTRRTSKCFQCPHVARTCSGFLCVLGTRWEDRTSLEEVRKYGGLRRGSVSTISCERWGAHPVVGAEEMTIDQLGGCRQCKWGSIKSMVIRWPKGGREKKRTVRRRGIWSGVVGGKSRRRPADAYRFDSAFLATIDVGRKSDANKPNHRSTSSAKFTRLALSKCSPAMRYCHAVTFIPG